jgi:hypothetical protein
MVGVGGIPGRYDVMQDTPTTPGYGAAIMGGKGNEQEYIFDGKG